MKKIIGMVVCMLVTVASVLPPVAVAMNDTKILHESIYANPTVINLVAKGENNAVNNKVSILSDSDEVSWQWAKQVGGSDTDLSLSIFADSNGNSYVTGLFSGTASFGGILLTSSGDVDVFVAKLNSAGDFEWVVQAGGGDGDGGSGISVDSNGNSYVTGFFGFGCLGGSTASFGDTVLTSGYEGYDLFIAKLDANGNWLWAKSAPGSNRYSIVSKSISIDSNGNSYITGYFWGTISFGDDVIIKDSLNDYDIFVAKMDIDGNWQWAKQAGGSAPSTSDDGIGISVDSYGNSYVTGDFMGTALFGDIVLYSNGGHDVFVAKLDTNGNWLWVKQAGGGDGDGGSGISVDSNGNSYVTGCFLGTASFGDTVLNGGLSFWNFFVAKLDTNGNWQWAKKADEGILSGSLGCAISADSSGNSYVIGDFVGSVSFGGTILRCSGSCDIFVVKLDTNGNWQWAKNSGGSDNLYVAGFGISVDSNKNVYVTGDFYGATSFDSITLSGYGDHDIFVAKLIEKNQPPNKPIITGQTIGKPGTSYDYDFTATDPNGDDVKYYIDWGDGDTEWTSFSASGTPVIVSHTWAEKGIYIIKAKAKDINGLIGPEGTMVIAMPVTQPQSQSSSLLQKVSQQLPNAFPILQRLLGL